MQAQNKEGEGKTAGYSEETKVVNKGKGWRKWLRRFGAFLVYGGWMLLVIVGFALYIIIALNVKCVMSSEAGVSARYKL